MSRAKYILDLLDRNEEAVAEAVMGTGKPLLDNVLNANFHESAPPSVVSPKRILLNIEPSFSAPLLTDININQDSILVENVEELRKDPKSPYSEISGIEELNSSPVRVFSDSSVSWYPDSEKKRCAKKKKKVYVATSSSDSEEEEYLYRKKAPRTPKKNLTTTPQHCASSSRHNFVDQDSALPSTSTSSLGVVSNILPEQKLEPINNNRSTISTPVKITRWKKNDPSKWKKNISKSNRQNCLPYMGKRGQLMPAKMPKPVKCNIKSCRYKCLDCFTEDDRIKLCESYWNIEDYTAKKQFLSQKVIALPIKTKKVGIPQEKHRIATYAYHFEKNEIKVRVCKDFFLKTLCISNGPVIETMKYKDELGNYTKKDGRGSREPTNKTSAEVEQKVIEHINKFPRVESHYCRKKSKRHYLDSKLTIAKMYELYKQERTLANEELCSFYVYKSIFGTKFNLSFFKPKKDLCLICTRFDNAGRPDHLKEEYELHQARKHAAQQAKDFDKLRSIADDNYLVVTADMQSTLHIPVSAVGILYYTRKLNVQNYTIHTSKPPHNAYCITWNEIHGKRGSVEIASAINWWISQIPSNIKEVTMYSDTCAGQNRNQFITAYLAHLIQQPTNQLSIIEQKYLESGHTHMEVDSMHSAIEREQRNTSVYSMIDWKSIMGRARSKRHKDNAPPYNVKELTFNDMLDVRSLNERFMKNITKDKQGKKIQWLKIKCLRFERQCPGIVKFRYSHDGPYSEFDIFEQQTTLVTRKRKRCQDEHNNAGRKASMIDDLKNYEIPKAYSSALPISEAKKKDLLNLCVKGIIPDELHPWFASLPTSKDVVDRNLEPDVTEDIEEED